MLEMLGNPATADQIGDCVVKSLQVRQKLRREAIKNKTKIQDAKIPRLWILTPTESPTILSQFPATEDPNWLPGIYFLGAYFTTAIVVIHQLPPTPETIWLRVLGRGKVQSQAIDELRLLPDNNPFRSMSLKLLYNLEQNLQENKLNLDEENRELIMRLKPLYERNLELAVQQGLQQERRIMIESLLITRFGSLDESLTAIIAPLSALSPAEFTPLLLNLSREELLAHFANQ